MPPTKTNGKICYLEIPTTDVNRSSKFYERVFRWNMRKRGDGHLAFDDAVAHGGRVFVSHDDRARQALARHSARISRKDFTCWLRHAKRVLDLLLLRPARCAQSADGKGDAALPDKPFGWWLDPQSACDG